MKIEIWSDIVCPFCFIGKHRMENALAKFPEEKFEIIWKSFQLNPDEITDPTLNHAEHLAAVKGWSREQTLQAHMHVCQMGETCGVGFEFEKVKVVNSLDAHRLMHYAKTVGKQNELKENLFSAHFEKGMNIGDKNDLIAVAQNTGINLEETKKVLESNQFENDVKQDIAEANSLGIRGVPYFIFGRKYAVSGAQDESVFVNTVAEMLKEKTAE